MQSLLDCAIVLFAGLICAKLIGLLKLPDVTSYLIAGILIGPSVLGLVSSESLSSLEIISDVALSMIAFVTGIELKFSEMKESGPAILSITLWEVLGAFIAVAVPMVLIFKQSVAFAITLGAIATATAPAATLMVIKQYKARGPLVSTLVPVVALDDGFCIMMFGICSTIAASLMSGADITITNMLLVPLGQIVGALGLGFVVGLLVVRLLNFFKTQGDLTAFVLAAVFVLTYLSGKWGLSSLLVMMTLGSTISNLSNQHMTVLNSIDSITPPLFMMFFVLSGAELNLSVVKDIGWIGIAYILLRIVGKMAGTYFSAKAAKMPPEVYRYMGFALLPQAGVAIGLSLIAVRIIPAPYGEMIRTIVLAATIIYEILGPVVAKWALVKAGEISPANLASSKRS